MIGIDVWSLWNLESFRDRRLRRLRRRRRHVYVCFIFAAAQLETQQKSYRA